MRDSSVPANPSRSELDRRVWLFGVVAVLLLWSSLVVLVGGLSGRLLEVACEVRLFVPLALFLCGWTGAWLYRRRGRRPRSATNPPAVAAATTSPRRPRPCRRG
jgi:hypothetical protein